MKNNIASISSFPVIFRSSTTESSRASIANLILSKNGPYRNLKIALAPVMELGAQEPILGGKKTFATLKWYLDSFSYTQRGRSTESLVSASALLAKLFYAHWHELHFHLKVQYFHHEVAIPITIVPVSCIHSPILYF